MNRKGIIFTIDAVLALLFIILLSIILNTVILEKNKEIEEILINNRISDLLISAQILEIKDIKTLEKNYLDLLNNKSGYIIINKTKLEINKSLNKNRLITQNIKYINSSNKEIYIEIGVYF